MNASFKRRFHITRLLAIPLLFGMLAFGSSAFAATEQQIEESIEAGITWLVDQQLADGSWRFNLYSQGTPSTCFALIKLQDRAFELGFDSPFDEGYAYSANVLHGWQYVLSGDRTKMQDLSVQTQGDPDTNGNGYGVYFQYDNYHTNYTAGICLMALAGVGDLDRPNDGSLDFDGGGVVDTYGELIQETVDWLAFSQSDGGTARGGWYYYAHDKYAGPADNSHTGYVTMGLAAAQGCNATVPDFVKDELEFWIAYIQNANGGSGYGDPSDWVNVLKTGNLLFEIKFVDEGLADPSLATRFENALAYIEDNWHVPGNNYWRGEVNAEGWGYDAYPAKYQAMFAVMKGLEYSNMHLIDLDADGNRDDDWFNQEPPLAEPEDFASVLVGEQNPDGSWPVCSWGNDVLCTTWALLTLEKIAPESDPFEVTVTKDYRYTAVCFERDNDGDGEFNEDPVNFTYTYGIDGSLIDKQPINDDGDELFNEDPVDCDPSDAGYELPMTGEDPEAYTVEAVLKKNGKVTGYNPGQYYAVSRLEICRHNPTIETVVVTFDENYRQCTCGDYPLSERSPKQGGGSVVVVEVVDGVPYQIYDANSGVVEFYPECGCDEGGALVEFEYSFAPDQENAELLVYVKFAPGLAGIEFDEQATNMCENFNAGILEVFDDQEPEAVFTTGDLDNAWLKVVPK